MDFSRSGVADDFVSFDEMVPAATPTRAILTHDAETLYIAVECAEPLSDRLATRGAEPGVEYGRDDVVEIRLSAPHHGSHVHQLMVTAAGKKQHAWFSKEDGDTRLIPRIDWQAAVSVVPGRWMVEMAVPFASLTSPSPADGERWRLNIIRYRHVEGREWSCWRCLYGSPHRTDLTGALVFSAAPAVEGSAT
jgi:hypothetical protein